MNLHPCLRDVAARYKVLDDAVRGGRLVLPEAISRFAWVGKDGGSLSLAHLTAAEPTLADDTDLSIPFTISVYDVDRDGDIVYPPGMLTANYAKNPVVFFGHQQHPIPVAKSVDAEGRLRVYPEENRIRAVAFFDREDPDSSFLYGKIKRGFLGAASIAFVPLSAYRRTEPEKGLGEADKARTHHSPMQPPGWYFERADMTEWSVVGVPANAGAIRDALDAEKSFLSPRMQKAFGQYAATAKGCWNGWCPSPPPSSTNPMRTVSTASARLSEKAVGKALPPKAPGKSLAWREVVKRYKAAKDKDALGGELPAVGRAALQAADFITLPRDVQGTNCSECRFEKDGKCSYVSKTKGIDLRGQPVNERNCCAEWDAPGTLRAWKEGEGAAVAEKKHSCGCPDCKAHRPCPCKGKVAKAVRKEQPSDDISPEKACQILHDGEANGHPLTDAQRRMFGAACGKKQWLKHLGGGKYRLATAVEQKQLGSQRRKGVKVTVRWNDSRGSTGQAILDDGAKLGDKITTSAGTATVINVLGPSTPRDENPAAWPPLWDARRLQSHKGRKQLLESSGAAGGYTVPAGETTDAVSTEGRQTCESCDGSGNCATCEGSGEIGAKGEEEACPDCDGSGDCPECEGVGFVDKPASQVGGLPPEEKRQTMATRKQKKAPPRRKAAPPQRRAAAEGRHKAAANEEDERRDEEVPPPEEEEALTDEGNPDEGPGANVQPYKPIALKAAGLYAHLKEAKDFMDRELPAMDDSPMKDHLQGEDGAGGLHEHLDKGMEHIKAGMEEYHPDHDLDAMVKDLEGQGPAGTETGEANLVDRGDIPPEGDLDPDDDDEVEAEGTDGDIGPEGADQDVPFAGEETPGEEAAEAEEEENPDTEEILERYRTGKGWVTRKVGRVRVAKDGRKFLVQKGQVDRSLRKDLTNPGNPAETVPGGQLPAEVAMAYKAAALAAADHMESLASAPDLPQHHTAGLLHHAERLKTMAKGLDEQGAVEENNPTAAQETGHESPLADEGNPAETKGTAVVKGMAGTVEKRPDGFYIVTVTGAEYGPYQSEQAARDAAPSVGVTQLGKAAAPAGKPVSPAVQKEYTKLLRVLEQRGVKVNGAG